MTEPGRYSQRGGLIDIWPPHEPSPVRLEFEANTLESLRTFDPATQRSRQSTEWLRLTPAREGLPRFYRAEWDSLLPHDQQDDPLERREARLEFFLPWMHDSPSGLMDYVPEGALVLFDDRAAVEDMIAELEEQALGLRKDQVANGQLPLEAPVPYLGLSEITDLLPAGRQLDFGFMQSGDASPRNSESGSERPRASAARCERSSISSPRAVPCRSGWSLSAARRRAWLSCGASAASPPLLCRCSNPRSSREHRSSSPAP